VRADRITPPSNGRIDELFPEGTPAWVPVGGEHFNPPEGFLSWRKFFIEVDAFLKDFEGQGPYFLRHWALKRAEKWMLDHNDHSEGLAAIFPAMLNTILGMIPIHGNDVWLHGITAVVAAYFGWRQPATMRERRHILGDRRQRMFPIARERRLGLTDRREGFGGMSPA